MGVSSALGSSALLPAGLGFRNVLINGDMGIAQRATSAASITGSGYHTVDRWVFAVDSAGTWTMTQENDAPAGFRKSAKVLCTVANTLAAGDNLTLLQRIEGVNAQGFRKGSSASRPFALSFWVKSNLTGTYVVELYDIDNTRQVSASYTINASGVWEYKTIMLPADPNGQLDYDNNNSLQCTFWLMAGSNFSSGTLNTSWASVTNTNRAAGQANLAATVNNYWQVTGVQLEANYQPTPFEQRPYGVELALCQRYYWRWQSANSGDLYVGVYQPASSPIYQLVPLPVKMRARPTSATISGAGTWSVINTSATPSIYDRGDSWVMLQSAVNAGVGATAQSGFFSNANSSFIAQDAEL